MRGAAAFALLLAACAVEDGGEPAGDARSTPVAADADTPVSSDDPLPPAYTPQGPTPDCPILGSSDWAATVIGIPPDAGDRLRITGRITVPGAGWHLELTAGPVLEIHPPIQRIELKAAPSEEGGTTGSETLGVRGEFPALAEYGAVEIHCGDRRLATVRDIAWTQ